MSLGSLFGMPPGRGGGEVTIERVANGFIIHYGNKRLVTNELSVALEAVKAAFEEPEGD